MPFLAAKQQQQKLHALSSTLHAPVLIDNRRYPPSRLFDVSPSERARDREFARRAATRTKAKPKAFKPGECEQAQGESRQHCNSPPCADKQVNHRCRLLLLGAAAPGNFTAKRRCRSPPEGRAHNPRKRSSRKSYVSGLKYQQQPARFRMVKRSGTYQQ